MKKLVATAAIVLGLTLGAAAQNGGGLFQKGETQRNSSGSQGPALPAHGLEGNQPAEAPLGGGALLLIGFGAAYMMGKRKEK